MESKKKLIEKQEIIHNYQRQRLRVGELDEGGQKVQTFSYKMNKRVDSSSSHYMERKTIF